MKHMRTMLAAAVSTMLLTATSALAQSPGKHGDPPPPPGSQSAPTENAATAGAITPAPTAINGAVPVHGQAGGSTSGTPAHGKGKKGKTHHPAPGGAAGNGGH
jgi:hypothetical protein